MSVQYCRHRPEWRPFSGKADLYVVLLIATAWSLTGVAAAQDQSKEDRAEVALTEISGVAAPAPRSIRTLDEQSEVRELYAAAVALVEEKNYTGALERLKRALDLAEGDYYELPYLMAVAKYHLHDYGEARSLAELAAMLHHGSADVHYLLGRLLYRQGQLERAQAQFRTATLAAEDEPNNPHVTMAWYRLGRCLAEGGYWSAACTSYAEFDEAIWETHPEQRRTDEIARLLVENPYGMVEARLDLLRRLEKNNDVIRVAEEAHRRRPEEIYLTRLYARALLDGEQATEALALCREQIEAAITAGSVGTSPMLSLAVEAARTTGRLDEWLAEVEQDVSEGRRIELAAALAHRLSSARQFHAAARLWQAIIQKQPHDIDAAWALAGALRAAGQLEHALTLLTQFIQRNPGAIDIPHDRLEAWLNSFETAARFPQLVARRSGPDDHDGITDFVLGTMAAAAEQRELAEKLFSSALEAKPDFTLTRIAWGRMLLSEYRWEEAQAQARAALEHAPQSAAAHFILAEAHAGLDQNEPAEEEYKAALKYSPDDASYALALARHYRRQGELTATQRYFQQALSADPLNVEAVENLIDSYLAGNKIQFARAQLRQAETRALSDDVLRRIQTTLRFARSAFQEEHLAELTRQLTEFPEDPETGLKLAAGLYIRGRYDKSYPVIERVHAQIPNDERAAVLWARLLQRRLEYAPAIEILAQLSRRYPNRSEKLALLAESYLIDFRPADARRALRRLLELGPDKQVLQECRGRLFASYVEFSDFDGALQLLKEWLAEDPDNNAWLFQKFWVLGLAGRHQEAIDLASERLSPVADEFKRLFDRYKKLAEQCREEPGDHELLIEAQALEQELDRIGEGLRQRRAELVQVCMEARQFQLIEEQLRHWLTLELDTARVTEWLIQVLIADERPEAALEVLNGFRPTDPQADIAARGWRALAEMAAGHPEKAVAELESVLDEQPSPLSPRQRVNVWEQLIQTYTEAKRYEDALARCDEWFKEFDRGDTRSRALWLSCKSSVLMQAERVDEYFELAEQLLELNPDDIDLNNDLGYTWADAGQNVERAIRMLRKVVASDPLRAAYLDSLGWAYYKAGDFAAAQEYLCRAVRLREGQDAVLYDHLGDAEYRLGDHDAARAAWQKVLKLVENEPAEREIARQTRVLARVRTKLAALEYGEPPETAPTAQEQEQESE